MDKDDKTDELFQKKIETNYITYINELQGITCTELIDRAEEIAATKQIYKELGEGGYNTGYMEYLLRFKNPLEVVRDRWLNEHENGYILEQDMEHVLWTLADKRDAEQDYELDETYYGSEQGEGVQMC